MARAGRGFPVRPVVVRPRAAGRVLIQVTAAGLVRPLGGTKVRVLGKVTEAGVALPVTRVMARPLRPVVESGQAAALPQVKVRALGPPVETGSAWPLARVKARAAGQVSEAGTARPLRGWAAVRRVDEFGVALPIIPAKILPLGTVTGAGQAAPTGLARGGRLVQVVETAQGRPLGRVKTRPLGPATDVGTARLIRPQPPIVVALGKVTDTGIVRPILHLTPPLRVGVPFTVWAASPPAVGWYASSPHTEWSAGPPTPS